MYAKYVTILNILIYINKLLLDLYLVKILLDQSVMINKFKAWHVDLIEKVQKITGLSNYQIIWISFAEGLIIGFLIGYFI